MIASHSFAAADAPKSRLDVAVAALAGLSIAFVVYAAPADLLAQLILDSGLPSLLPAAEPPLGAKARLGLGGAGAATAFVLALMLLRWLDRFSDRAVPAAAAAPPELELQPAFEVEAPRLRRRDHHPDAPPRPPLFAIRDLGDPEPQREPEPEPRQEPKTGATPLASEPAPPPPSVRAVVQPPAGASQAESIDALMARLEQGLARRRTGAAATTPADPPATPDPADDRLQSAIASLQRLTSRAG